MSTSPIPTLPLIKYKFLPTAYSPYLTLYSSPPTASDPEPKVVAILRSACYVTAVCVTRARLPRLSGPGEDVRYLKVHLGGRGGWLEFPEGCGAEEEEEEGQSSAPPGANAPKDNDGVGGGRGGGYEDGDIDPTSASACVDPLTSAPLLLA
eukprot:CAMPEP_0182476262 /NCGR_PEP_ID=MMETSP1319-20130603/28736_1 /TAXON_ID=172717 /ORGANISM="Bolidomonas pacifica, Strain RCC208" /LENGTH=150 /DNA_ID=CAMNT_0024677333 /DNA_START=195 /DNA_END=643 /DNA_ORIENTATION=+